MTMSEELHRKSKDEWFEDYTLEVATVGNVRVQVVGKRTIRGHGMDAPVVASVGRVTCMGQANLAPEMALLFARTIETAAAMAARHTFDRREAEK